MGPQEAENRRDQHRAGGSQVAVGGEARQVLTWLGASPRGALSSPSSWVSSWALCFVTVLLPSLPTVAREREGWNSGQWGLSSLEIQPDTSRHHLCTTGNWYKRQDGMSRTVSSPSPGNCFSGPKRTTPLVGGAAQPHTLLPWQGSWSPFCDQKKTDEDRIDCCPASLILPSHSVQSRR